MCNSLYVITKEKGQMPLPTNREHMTPTRWKKASIATKSSHKKRRKARFHSLQIER